MGHGVPYSVRREQIIKARDEGLTQRQTAERLGITRHTVKGYASKWKISFDQRPQKGFTVLQFPPTTLAKLKRVAAERGRRWKEFLVELIVATVEDDLFDAVLDDGGRDVGERKR